MEARLGLLPERGETGANAGSGAGSTGQDLRGYLRFLAEHHPDQIYRVTRAVEPRFEVAGVLDQLERRGRLPVVVFENVRGSRIPLVANVHGTFQRLAIALGLPPDADVLAFTREYGRRESQPIPPLLVDAAGADRAESGGLVPRGTPRLRPPAARPAGARTDHAPVQEVVLAGDAVDLGQLPLLTYHALDGGAYITVGFTVMRDPESGVRNAGIYRLMRQGRDTLGVQLSETGHGHYIWRKNERRGLPTPVAIFIGHHPAVHLGCLSFTPLEVDELAVAGAMLGAPLRLVRCRTVPLEVPADAEIVLEGEIPPDVRAPEAPFGEYPGTYGPRRMNPIVRVKAITMRRQPLYQESFVGHPDHLLMGGVTRLSYIRKTVQIACPTVRQVYVPPAGACRFICYVAMEKLVEGDPKNAAMAAFAADPFLKFVIVVDEDVDILNDSDVLHAIATRVRADQDTFVVTHARGSPLDPASYDPAGGSHIVTKVGIDATRKATYPDEIGVPGTDAIDPDTYLVPVRR